MTVSQLPRSLRRAFLFAVPSNSKEMSIVSPEFAEFGIWNFERVEKRQGKAQATFLVRMRKETNTD
jgi:hypothetical protein